MKTLLRFALLSTPLFLTGIGLAQLPPSEADRRVRIISKPKAAYTERARKAEIEGSVLLKVTLLAGGEVGEIRDVTKKNRKKLAKYGLVGQAMEAAKQIRFTPKIVNGKPISVVITIEYVFSVY